MADRVQLVIVIHNHQPVGNFDEVIDEACENAYLPFLKMLNSFPRIRIGLHTSGCLWEWLETHRPEYGRLVAELLASGQIELLGGGMYEPILPVLPERDAVWQLNRLSRFLHHRFRIAPQGMWCPERVWEPHLPAVLAKAGLKYTLLDDYHFRGAASPDQIASDYFITEHAGQLVALLPISKELRYTIPFKPAADTLQHLRQLAEDSTTVPLAVFGDDGEKFGVWPDTYEWVYEKGWLEDFFTQLTANLDWIDLLLPGELLEQRRPAAKVFVPCTSYMEMGEWTRIDPHATADDPPGFWRNYLHKYPEVNAMYRRMLGVSQLVHQAHSENISGHILAEAEDDIGRAQCNCAYWHGIFGGLYLNYLRQSLCYHINRAEQSILDHCPALARQNLTVTDHDGLGWDQYVLRSDQLTLVADPGRGLCISRLDYRPTLFCWTDVLARRLEAYHAKILTADVPAADEHASIHDRVILKEPGLDRKLVVDPHQRVSFTTYFSELNTAARLLEVAIPPETFPCFSRPDYGLALVEPAVEGTQVAGVVDYGDFRLKKSLQLTGAKVLMRLSHSGGTLPADLGRFIVEFNLTVLTDQSDDRYLDLPGQRQAIRDPGDWAGPTWVRLVDGWQQRAIRLGSPQMRYLHYYPLRTVSSSEGGFESTYQGSCLMLGFDPQALIGGIEIELEVEDLVSHDMLPGEL